MGFFDTVKDKAGALAADAERAGKVTAAQARLVVLQNELRKAERELGHQAIALVERGELDHPELAPIIARLRATTAEVRAKEAEIASLRGTASGEPAAVAVVPEPAEATTKDETASVPAEPVADEVAEATAAKKAPARKPGAAKAAARKPGAAKAAAKKPATKKAAAKKPATKKAPAKKAAAAPAAPTAPRRRATKGGTGATAGATPKKADRPLSTGPRPAGKKKPAGT